MPTQGAFPCGKRYCSSSPCCTPPRRLPQWMRTRLPPPSSKASKASARVCPAKSSKSARAAHSRTGTTSSAASAVSVRNPPPRSRTRAWPSTARSSMPPPRPTPKPTTMPKKEQTAKRMPHQRPRHPGAPAAQPKTERQRSRARSAGDALRAGRKTPRHVRLPDEKSGWQRAQSDQKVIDHATSNHPRMPLITLILFPLIGSLVAAVLPTNSRNSESTLPGLIALLCTVQVALCFPEIADGAVLRQELAWLPALGLNLVLRLDGLAWMFCMLVFGVGSLVVLYARYYMSAADPVPRFFAFFLAFMGAMVGVVLSGNLIQIAFFWELTSLFSFLLIGYWHHRSDARRRARMALSVTASPPPL